MKTKNNISNDSFKAVNDLKDFKKEELIPRKGNFKKLIT